MSNTTLKVMPGEKAMPSGFAFRVDASTKHHVTNSKPTTLTEPVEIEMAQQYIAAGYLTEVQ